ncbi:MAG: hypothetical protein ACREOZ_01085, partial [Gloeomargaritales cyanobacterium]
MNTCISDPQVRFQLFKICVQPKIAHLELPDMLFSPEPTGDPTVFSTQSASTVNDFLSTLLYGQHSTRQLSELSSLQAIQPVSNGGLGLRSTQEPRIGRYLVPVIRSIRHALDGISLSKAPVDEDHPPLTIILPDSLKKMYQPWQTFHPKLVSIVHHLQAHIQQLPRFADIAQGELLPHLVLQAPLTGLAKCLYRQLVNSRLVDLKVSLPANDNLTLASHQNHLATVPVAHMTRRIVSNRLHPADFRTLVGLTIQADIFDDSTPHRCFCSHADFDKKVHHSFSCSEIHKTRAHDIVRDALYTIFKKIIPYVPSIGNAVVCKEQPGYHRTATRLRPGDVSIHYGETRTNLFSALIVDVTSLGFTPESLHHDVSKPVTDTVIQHHVSKERDKFRGGRGYSGGPTFISGEDVMATLNQQDLQFVPFTWDAGGSLGPCAHDLLFGSKEIATSKKCSPKLHLPGQEALRRTSGKDRLTGILRQADKGWIELHGRSKWFTPHYQTTLPSTFAKHTLGLAIARARLHLISRVKRRLRSDNLKNQVTFLTIPDPGRDI